MAEKDTHGIVTSDSVAKAHHLPRLSLNKRPLKLIVAFAVMLAIVLGGWLLWRMEKNHSASQNVLPARSHIDIASSNAMDQADAGDYSGAIINLNQEINLAASNKDKGMLAETKAVLANNAGQYQDGLTFARQAEALNPTSNSAYLIASNAESLGDKATALAYYQKALARLDTTTRNRAPDIVDMYKQKIAELQK